MGGKLFDCTGRFRAATLVFGGVAAADAAVVLKEDRRDAKSLMLSSFVFLVFVLSVPAKT